MFLKPFKVKSNSKVKSSERKKFSDQLQKDFLLSDEDMGRVVGKSEVWKLKLFTHNEDSLFVYSVNQQPLIMEIDRLRIPTVYLLWQLPGLLPTFTTHDQVLPRLQNGADLMLPGVVPPNPPGLRMYGALPKGQACAVNTAGNRAPVAVGYTAMSCEDMYMAAGRGRAVVLTHVFGDELWNLGDRSRPPLLPWLRPSEPEEEKEDEEEEDAEEENEEPVAEEEEEEEEEREEEQSEGEDSPSALGAEAAAGDIEEAAEDAEDAEPEVLPDELLTDCFLHALRLSVKDRILPLHANVLYGRHVLSFVPPGQRLDIRRTSFRKFGAFLDYMAAERLIEVDRPADGVQLLRSVNRAHPRLAGLRLHLRAATADGEESEEAASGPSKGGGGQYTAPAVDEVWFVVGHVLPFFEPLGVKKGDALSAAEVKRLLTGYVKDKGLHAPHDRSVVVLDPLLQRVLFHGADASPAQLPWRDLSARLLGRMTAGHRLQFPDEPPLLRRTPLPMVGLSVESRGGRKQVTLVAGAEAFRVDLGELARAVQVGRACSAAVTEDKRGRTVVLAQGDQRVFVSTLLTETYGLPRRCIEGFEEVGKKKKRRR